MSDVPSFEALMDAQIAAEDAVGALGLEVWSVADPATGEVVLHLSNTHARYTREDSIHTKD